MTDFVLYERDHAVVTLTLNRPRERNALSTQAQWDELVSCCERIRRDESIKVVILTGAGTAFSAGGNVKDMRDKRGIASGSPYAIAQSYQTGIQRIPLALHQLEVPTIAAVNGPAVGAGCDLACMCDIRIAGQSARFAESFVKVGIIPGDGGAWLLPRILGISRAAEMAFTGDTIDAAQALAWGLVSRVVPDGELMAATRDLANRIAANPPYAVRMTKRLLREGQSMSLESLLQLSAAMQSLAHATADHKEAVAAFIAKRTPKFGGN